MPKRKAKQVIDLTGDGDSEHEGSSFSAQPSKAARLDPPLQSKKGGSRHNEQPGLPTPPHSSQPYSGRGDSGQFSSQCSSTYGLGGESQAQRNTWVASTQEIEDRVNREIDPTLDDDDDVYANYQLYGVLNTKIVGIRYYTGRATVGEYVKVRREPRNPYDSNAIRIDNVMGDQIGHIGRNVAARLAGLMDSKALLVEGALTGVKGDFDCPIGLKLFGSTDPVRQATTKQQMQALKLPVNELTRAEAERKKQAKALAEQQKARNKAAAAMRKQGHVVIDAENPPRYANFNMPGSNQQAAAPDVEQLLSGTAVYNPREVQDMIKQFASGEDVLSSMEMAEQPKAMASVLLPYQLQGLQWLLDHESPRLPGRGSKDVVQLWKNDNGVYTNIATSFSVMKAPELASGGILADDMGLGKTIQIISLVMADPHKTTQPTLIISPLSVMSNWSEQAARHVKKQFAPRVLVYHGQENRGLSPTDFEAYDIVVTTYQTMTLELFPDGKSKAESVPTKKGLFSITWRRVVLDEGHQIRNPKAKMSRAACSLMATSRWILSGTPIVNSLKDLYSHVKFLRMSGGLDEFEAFNSLLIRPLKSHDPNAPLLLQALMSTLCLRRMKDMRFIDLKLPRLTFHKYTVKFLPHEQKKYNAFRDEAKGLVEEARVKKGNQTMIHLLEVLLRLRQVCNHWKMCGEERVQNLMELIEENQVVDPMDPANRRALQDLLQLRIDSQEDCAVCMDTMRRPVITACGHAFCQDCIEKVIETQHKCPMDRIELLDNKSLVQPATDFGESGGEETTSTIDTDASSSKIEALVEILKASDRERGTKTIVFSQWTSFLDLVQTQLLKQDLNFTRLDGKMSASRRDAAVHSLNHDASCKIMLASLAVCSVGLNLVAANHVILADSWWAPAIEDQAVDRVHRLGQTRDCKVIRLVVEDTIEDEVLEIQAKKRKLAATAFGEREGRRNREELQTSRLRDIEQLLR